uniref:Glycolipid transfer protein domain-containing protein n=1 Tax=Plectus sambesii TaxID=2011161 RepID=A0A914XIH7_9BILA
MTSTPTANADGSSSDVQTYFSKPEHLYPALDTNNDIPTEQFISACNGIAEFVGFLGTAFTPVKNDIAGNVLKVKTKYNLDRENCSTVQKLVETDLSQHGGRMGIPTEGLLWLKRGLEFMLELLTLMVSDYKESKDKKKTENLVQTIRKAYEMTLKRHHGFVSKQLFKLVIHAAPYRKDILKAVALGQEGKEDLCIDHIAAHLGNFRANVNSLVQLYYAKGLETPPASTDGSR